MNFMIEKHADHVTDSEIKKLLTDAYVGGGFTSPGRAAIIFVPSSVRSRGNMIVARTTEGVFAGMVIVVRPDSPARRLAEPDEAEIHLLAVDSIYRGQGLGRMLMTRALETIRDMGFEKAVLWTQPTMLPAQRLYESLGFVRAHWRDPVLDGVDFLAYEKKQLQLNSAASDRVILQEILLRNATINDATGIGSVIHTIPEISVSARQSLSTTVDVVKANLIAGLSTPCTSVYVAEIASEIVGYVSCHWIPSLLFKGGEGYVTELFVRPNFSGSGIGTKLLRLVEEEARVRGSSRLILLNSQSRKSYEFGFYLKRGWTEREQMRNFVLTISNTSIDSETAN